jgi:hypothetical protein
VNTSFFLPRNRALLLLLELLVLIMEALLPEENLFEALVQTSYMDCVHSVESVFHYYLVCFSWVQAI